MLMYSVVGVLECVQKRFVRFVTGSYNYENGSVTDILGQLKWESIKNRGKDNILILSYKRLKGEVKSVNQQYDLVP